MMKVHKVAHTLFFGRYHPLPGVAETTHKKIYYVMDAARSEEIYPLLQEWQKDTPLMCLYQGETAKKFADVCPYLLELDMEDQKFPAIFEKLWGKEWGIFVRSSKSFNELRRHLRQFTMIKTEDHESLIFRFYDPVVFQQFMKVCLPDQMEEIFAEIDWIMAENEARDGAVFWEYQPDRSLANFELSIVE